MFKSTGESQKDRFGQTGGNMQISSEGEATMLDAKRSVLM